jgi:hypothetical protein
MNKHNLFTKTIDMFDFEGLKFPIYLQKFTLKERSEIALMLKDTQEIENEDKKINKMSEVIINICLKCIKNDEGKRIFDNTDVEMLENVDAEVLENIFNKIMEINGMTDDGVKDASKN